MTLVTAWIHQFYAKLLHAFVLNQIILNDAWPINITIKCAYSVSVRVCVNASNLCKESASISFSSIQKQQTFLLSAYSGKQSTKSLLLLLTFDSKQQIFRLALGLDICAFACQWNDTPRLFAFQSTKAGKILETFWGIVRDIEKRTSKFVCETKRKHNKQGNSFL